MRSRQGKLWAATPTWPLLPAGSLIVLPAVVDAPALRRTALQPLLLRCNHGQRGVRCSRTSP